MLRICCGGKRNRRQLARQPMTVPPNVNTQRFATDRKLFRRKMVSGTVATGAVPDLQLLHRRRIKRSASRTPVVMLLCFDGVKQCGLRCGTVGGNQKTWDRCARKSDERSAMRFRFKRGRSDDLETLRPAYFALIMVTGIVVLATYLRGISALPSILFWLNAFFFVTLITMTGVRIVRYPDAFTADLHSYGRGVGFFTVIALSECSVGCCEHLQISSPHIGVRILGRDHLALLRDSNRTLHRTEAYPSGVRTVWRALCGVRRMRA